jgi:hypothetical protein
LRLGDFPSVAAAARAAGIPTAQRVALSDPQTVARHIVAKGDDFARAVVSAIEKDLGEVVP